MPTCAIAATSDQASIIAPTAPPIATSTTASSTSPAQVAAQPIPISSQPRSQLAPVHCDVGASSSLSSSNPDIGHNGNWEEPHPGQRLAFPPLQTRDINLASENCSLVAAAEDVGTVGDGSGGGTVLRGSSIAERSGSIGDSRTTAGVSMNGTAAKGANLNLTSSASSSSSSHRQRVPLASSWFARRNSRLKNRAADPPPPPSLTIPSSTIHRPSDTGGSGSTSTMQHVPALAQSSPQDGLQSPSPLSPPPPQTPTETASTGPPIFLGPTWHSLDTRFGDEEDQPMDLRLERDSVCGSVTFTSLDASSLATWTLYGDDRTVISPEGDRPTIRRLSPPMQQLSDFSNFFDLQTPGSRQALAAQDSASMIRRTISSRHSNHTDDTATASFIFGSSDLSHSTTLERDSPDAYGWEAELEHRKSNASLAVPRSSAIDLRCVSNPKNNSGSSSRSSSSSVFSMSSETAGHHAHQREGSSTRRQSFFQRLFSVRPGKNKGSAPFDTPSVPIPCATKPTRPLTARPSSAATSNRPLSQRSSVPVPNMPALSLLLGNLSSMQENNRL